MTDREKRAISDVAERYRAQGYDIEVEPDGSSLPAFLGGYRPDIIATRGSEVVIVEVKTTTRHAMTDRFRDIAEQINQQPGWRFDLVVLNPDDPSSSPPDTPTLEVAEIERRFAQADAIFAAGQTEAAFLVLWTTLEAALRLAAKRASLPLERLPSSALIRELYSAGELSRDQFKTALALFPIRNAVVHGFATTLAATDIEQLTSLVRSIIRDA